MSVAEYEYECSRAELLGVEKPTWDEFCSRPKSTQGEQLEETQEEGAEKKLEEVDGEVAQTLGAEGESLKRNVGGLDELNSILASTQLKINKFKSVCGSFTNLMKLKSWKGGEGGPDEAGLSSAPNTPMKKNDGGGGDVETEVASQVDRLDSLIGKAERAEMSMMSQNKQMKSYLK